MTKKDIDNIISIICQNDEDFEKTCISPAYLKKELEALALEQEPCGLRIGDEVYIRANINEIRNDYIICENAGGYFGTVREEIRKMESEGKE